MWAFGSMLSIHELITFELIFVFIFSFFLLFFVNETESDFDHFRYKLIRLKATSLSLHSSSAFYSLCLGFVLNILINWPSNWFVFNFYVLIWKLKASPHNEKIWRSFNSNSKTHCETFNIRLDFEQPGKFSASQH